MAKRVPEDEKPFRPVDAALVRSVISPPVHAGNAAQEMAPLSATPPQISLATEKFDREKFDREKRMLLTSSEERAVERLVASLAEEVGTPVKLSHLLRACTSLVLKYEKQILEEARNTPKLTRPPNGDMKKLAEFEQGIARILETAFQDQ